MENTLNQNSVLQSITAATPEELTSIMRSIRVEVQILGFTANPGEHICYFRCKQKIIIRDKKAETAGRLDG